MKLKSDPEKTLNMFKEMGYTKDEAIEAMTYAIASTVDDDDCRYDIAFLCLMSDVGDSYSLEVLGSNGLTEDIVHWIARTIDDAAHEGVEIEAPSLH